MKGRRLLTIAPLVASLFAVACGKGGKDDELKITDDKRTPATSKTGPDDGTKPSKTPTVPTAAIAVAGVPPIALDFTGLLIGPTRIPAKPLIADFVAIYGKADRIEELANRIHVYESKGILLYETPGGSGRVIELTLFFDRVPDISFAPKSDFAGSLTVLGKPIDKSLKIADLPTKYPALKWESGLGNDFDAEIAGHHTFFLANEGDPRLAKVSISFPSD